MNKIVETTSSYATQIPHDLGEHVIVAAYDAMGDDAAERISVDTQNVYVSMREGSIAPWKIVIIG